MRRNCCCYRNHTNLGFTLLEVLVSLSLFSLASIAIAKSFTLHISTNNKSEQKTGAIMAAQRVLDQIRVLDPTTLPTSGTTSQNVTIGSRNYQTSTTYCNPSTYCSSTNVRFLTVKVQYRGSQLYAVDTIFSQLR